MKPAPGVTIFSDATDRLRCHVLVSFSFGAADCSELDAAKKILQLLVYCLKK